MLVSSANMWNSKLELLLAKQIETEHCLGFKFNVLIFNPKEIGVICGTKSLCWIGGTPVVQDLPNCSFNHVLAEPRVISSLE